MEHRRIKKNIYVCTKLRYKAPVASACVQLGSDGAWVNASLTNEYICVCVLAIYSEL